MKKYSVLEKSIIAKTTVNQVIAMRAIQRRLSTEIRRQLPVHQTVTSVGEFMDRLADKLEELSTSDSTDEFVWKTLSRRLIDIRRRIRYPTTTIADFTDNL